MNTNFQLLLLSLLGFLVAPFFVIYGKKNRSLYHLIDGFTISSIIFLSFFHLIPEALYQEGLWSFVLLILGFLSPKLLHSTQKQLLIFLIFLLVHTLLESSAIAVSNTKNLALAVALHNFPLGIFVFAKIFKEKGFYFGIGSIILIFIFSTIGFTLSDSIVPIQRFQFYLQSFIASSVLHILFDSLHHKIIIDDPKPKYHISSTLGAIMGIVFPVLFTSEMLFVPTNSKLGFSIASTFIKILLETSPILLFAFFLSGMLRIFLSPNTATWLKTGSSFFQSLKGVIFGLPLPICSCGILPLYKTLVQAGVPATAGMAFLIATPEIGLDALLITIPLLGTEFSVYRLVSAFLVAFLIAYFIGQRVPVCESTQTNEVKKIFTLQEKIKLGFKYGFLELFDHIMPWLIFGILVAALFEFLVDYEFFHKIPSYAQIPLFALLGIPTYVCATGATPFVAMAIHKGVSVGAGLAFLISGPATNVTTFAVLKSLHGKKTAYLFAIAVLTLAISFGFLVDMLPFRLETQNPNFLEKEDEWFEWVSLAILTLLFMYSSLRIGPRGILHQIEEHYH